MQFQRVFVLVHLTNKPVGDHYPTLELAKNAAEHEHPNSGLITIHEVKIDSAGVVKEDFGVRNPNQ
jgi:hypothetical protein